MLTDKELAHLQTLACIKLSPEEQVKFWHQLQGIITFLDKLSQMGTDGSQMSTDKMDKIENSLRILDGVKPFADAKLLLDNVEHEKVNNSIVIKSVLA